MAEKQDSDKQRLKLLEVELAELKNQVTKLNERGGKGQVQPREVSNDEAQLYGARRCGATSEAML